MNLMINYDFFNAVRNVNEPMTPFKVLRNEKNHYLKFNLPVYTLIDYYTCKNGLIEIIPTLILQFGFLTGTMALVYKKFEVDTYKDIAIKNLTKLAGDLENLNIETNYQLLLDTELLSKKYQLRLNKEKLPEILESKYLLVPSFNYNGEVKDTSLLQEHVVGSKQYVLSIGSPKKEHKLAYANI